MFRNINFLSLSPTLDFRGLSIAWAPFTYLCVLTFVMLMCSVASAQETQVAHTVKTDLEQARALILEEMEDKEYPGLAISVWRQGELIWSEGFGYANIEDEVPVSPSESLFRIGSISKALTSAGLARLVAEREFDLDAPIQQYVPYFPKKRWTITTRQVAQHTAGIRHYRGLEFWSNVHYDHVRDALAVFMEDTLLFRPGSDYAYSSYGWNLVSAAIEGSAGVPFIEFMQSNVFEPLGMHHTHPDDVKLTKLNRVTFYDYLNEVNTVSPDVDLSIKWAGGGFLSTSEDLIRFGEAMLHHRLVDLKTTQSFWTPAALEDGKSTNYGLGWASRTTEVDAQWVGHGGGSIGGSSMFIIYPDEELIVVLLINRTRAAAQSLAFRVATAFLGTN
jgi:CubicO group peptidase (beta-lactamase class C family)